MKHNQIDLSDALEILGICEEDLDYKPAYLMENVHCVFKQTGSKAILAYLVDDPHPCEPCFGDGAGELVLDGYISSVSLNEAIGRDQHEDSLIRAGYINFNEDQMQREWIERASADVDVATMLYETITRYEGGFVEVGLERIKAEAKDLLWDVTPEDMDFPLFREIEVKLWKEGMLEGKTYILTIPLTKGDYCLKAGSPLDLLDPDAKWDGAWIPDGTAIENIHENASRIYLAGDIEHKPWDKLPFQVVLDETDSRDIPDELKFATREEAKAHLTSLCEQEKGDKTEQELMFWLHSSRDSSDISRWNRALARAAKQYAKPIIQEFEHYMNGEAYGLVVIEFETTGDEWVASEPDACFGYFGEQSALSVLYEHALDEPAEAA